MKTADIQLDTVYAFRENTSTSSASAVLALEPRLWTERDEWYTTDQGERRRHRVLVRAREGSRAGRSGHSLGTTGIPVLRLQVHEGAFSPSADAERQIIDTAHDLLSRAALRLSLLDLVDSGEPVFEKGAEGPSVRRTIGTVWANYADGETREIQVHLALVRPQTLIGAWEDHLTAAQAQALAQVKLDQERAEARAKNNAVAQNITSRVDRLIGATARYDIRGDRYDVRRKSGISSTYEVGQDVLLKLLALAEKAADQ